MKTHHTQRVRLVFDLLALRSSPLSTHLFAALLVAVFLTLLQQLPPLAAHHHALCARYVLHVGHQLGTEHGVAVPVGKDRVSEGVGRAAGDRWRSGSGLTAAVCPVGRQICPSGVSRLW